MEDSKPNKIEVDFLTLAYNRFYDLYDEVMNDDFWGNKEWERFSKIKQAFDFVPWASLIFTSAVTGQNVAKIFDIIMSVDSERNKEINTSTLNGWLKDMVGQHPPAGLKNRRPRLNYITQTGTNPPEFTIFGAHTDFLHWSYKRFLDKGAREKFGFEGTGINWIFKEKRENSRKK